MVKSFQKFKLINSRTDRTPVVDSTSMLDTGEVEVGNGFL